MIPKFLPKNLSIIGSGAIGIEFASIYNALGSKSQSLSHKIKYYLSLIKIFQLKPKKYLKKGIKFELNAKISAINENKKKVIISNNDQSIESDALIMSIGVSPNLDQK